MSSRLRNLPFAVSPVSSSRESPALPPRFLFNRFMNDHFNLHRLHHWVILPVPFPSFGSPKIPNVPGPPPSLGNRWWASASRRYSQAISGVSCRVEKAASPFLCLLRFSLTTLTRNSLLETVLIISDCPQFPPNSQLDTPFSIPILTYDPIRSE
jgi:hypothetical protein